MNLLELIRQNMEGQPLRDGIDRPELVKVYRTAIQLAGLKNYDAESVSLDVTLTAQILTREFPSLTLKEVRYATEKGATGCYGEFHGINPKTFLDWVRAYRNSTEWKEARKNDKDQKQLPKPKTLSPDQMQKTWNEAKERYRHSGLVQGGVWLYGLGLDLGKINVQDELFIEEVRYNAQKTFEKRIEALKAQRLLQKRTIKELQAILEAEPEERSQNKTWIDQCKREAVKLIFKSEIENN